MKKVIRIMGLCALVALAATSCKKDAQTTSSFKATLTQPTCDAKTHLGSDSTLYWNAGDTIKVFDGEGTAYLFTTENENVAVATFSGNDALVVDGNYTAYYPAKNAVKDGEDYVKLTLANSQTYDVNSFANGTYPMVADYDENRGFTFRSDCGLLALQVKGSGSIGSIVLTSKSSTDMLAGDLKYHLDDGSFAEIANGQTTVTLNCGGVGLNATDSTVFYFALPAGVFANGFTAVLNDVMGTELSTLSTTNNNAIEAQKIRLMPAVTVGATGVEIVEEPAQADPTDPTQCTLSGTVTYSPGVVVEEVGFYYGVAAKGMNDLPGNLTNKVTLDYVPASGAAFEYTLTGLSGGTNYQYCIYIKISGNETYGTVESFTTTEPTYYITVSANPTAGGSITGGGTYNHGASCTLTATANTGYAFVNWTEGGTEVSTEASYSFTVEANRALVANFVQQHTIAATANPTAGGSITGGGTYNHGASCTLTATANTGYAFINWTKSDTVVSTNANYSFTVEADRTLVANFGLISFTENLDNGQLPEGWTTIDADGDGHNWVLDTECESAYGYNQSNAGFNGSHMILSGSYHKTEGALHPDNYLVSPKVTLRSGSTFSFYAGAQDYEYPAEHFGVFVSDNDTSDWTMVQDWTMTAKGASGNRGAGRDGNTRDQGNWHQYTVDLSAYAGEKYIAIRHFNSSDQFFLNVDNIRLGDPEPGTSFAQNFNNSVFPEGWTTIDADGDGYNWVLTNQMAAYGYSAPNDGHYGTVGMTSGSYAANGALTPDNYLVTPKVNLVPGSTFSFWACAQDADYAAEHFGVFVSDNGTSGWTMVQEWTMTAKGASGNKGNGRDGNTRDIGNWYQYTVDLSAYAGEKYIAIRHFNCSDEFFLEVDDILLTVNR